MSSKKAEFQCLQEHLNSLLKLGPLLLVPDLCTLCSSVLGFIRTLNTVSGITTA